MSKSLSKGQRYIQNLELGYKIMHAEYIKYLIFKKLAFKMAKSKRQRAKN
jgi:hypothetical protein